MRLSEKRLRKVCSYGGAPEEVIAGRMRFAGAIVAIIEEKQRKEMAQSVIGAGDPAPETTTATTTKGATGGGEIIEGGKIPENERRLILLDRLARRALLDRTWRCLFNDARSNGCLMEDWIHRCPSVRLDYYYLLEASG